MSGILEAAIKVTILSGCALGCVALLRNRSAALRHWVLAAAVFCAALTPLLTLAAPSWRLPMPSVGVREQSTGSRAATATAPIQSRKPATPAPVEAGSPARRIQLTSLVPVVWAAGVAINLSVLLVGVWQLTSLTRRARQVTDGAWASIALDISRLRGLGRPIRLLQSDHPSLLVTWGLVSPKIMLPAGADAWTQDRIRIVLCHEIAHIERGDWLVQTSAETLRSFYWFNPFLWLLCSRLRRESEHACDDAVMNLGVGGQEYATHLLELARAFGRQHRLWLPAPAIVPRQSGLERRVSAMLNSGLNRCPVTLFARISIVAALLALTLPLAAFAQNAFATLSGSIVDPQDAFLPGVEVVVTDTQRNAKHEVMTDRNGHFELVGLAQGDYVLEASIPGFKTSRQKLTLAGQDVQRDLKLQIGSLEETISVRGGPGRDIRWNSGPRRPLPSCGTSGAGRMGGNIRQPVKLTHIAPRYQGNLEGIVILETTIGTDGLVKDVRVVSSPHPQLTQAAVEAVKQWEFDETLLNCVPVETEMRVTVDFGR